jgi:hypothetical protein
MIDSEGIGSRDYPFIIQVVFTIPVDWNMNEPLVIIEPKYSTKKDFK